MLNYFGRVYEIFILVLYSLLILWFYNIFYFLLEIFRWIQFWILYKSRNRNEKFVVSLLFDMLFINLPINKHLFDQFSPIFRNFEPLSLKHVLWSSTSLNLLMSLAKLFDLVKTNLILFCWLMLVIMTIDLLLKHSWEMKRGSLEFLRKNKKWGQL